MLKNLNPKAILFDFYGTLVDIRTEEHDIQSWRVVSSFLRYQGAKVSPEDLQSMYFARVKESLAQSAEPYPDVNIIQIFKDILTRLIVQPSQGLEWIIARLFRSLTIVRFNLFSETLQVLSALAEKFRLGLVTDNQEAYIIPELRMVDLDGLFETIVISSFYGFRKPDPRLFQQALQEIGLSAGDVLYVGDNWDLDIIGAVNAGIQAVWINRGKNQEHASYVQMACMLHDLRGLFCLIQSIDEG